MSNFATELEVLILQWLARGENPSDMCTAMVKQIREIEEVFPRPSDGGVKED